MGDLGVFVAGFLVGLRGGFEVEEGVIAAKDTPAFNS